MREISETFYRKLLHVYDKEQYPHYLRKTLRIYQGIENKKEESDKKTKNLPPITTNHIKKSNISFIII